MSDKQIFLKAEWRKLALINYAIDPVLLKSYIPYKTELDFWNNKCYVSLVGFRFINTRLKGIPIPFHTNFEEINLRFYVRYKEGNLWKRGVTFIKEIVPKRALTMVANLIYNEKYVTMPTRHSWLEQPGELQIKYEWKHRGAWDTLSLTAAPGLIDIAPESDEEFITEHYWGYTQVNDNKTSQYQVEHPRWQTYDIKNCHINVRFGELYGEAFKFLSGSVPDSVMLAEGSAITVRGANRIRL